MSTAEKRILGYLEKNDEIEDSGNFAAEQGIDHADVVNVVKSLHGFRYFDVLDIKRETWVLTEEGRTYATEGSPEFQLFTAVPSEGSISKDELQKKVGPAVFKIGCSQARKNKWVEMGKQVSRKVQQVEDRVKELLLQIQDKKAIAESDIKSLKTRKLIALQTWKVTPTTKKRSRPPTTRPATAFSPTTAALLDAYPSDSSVPEASQKLRRTSSHSALSPSPRLVISFFDHSTTDVIVHIVTDPEDKDEDEDDVDGPLQIHLHSWALERSKYFAALLSSRWKTDRQVLQLPICPSRGSVENYLTVLRLMYSEDEELGFSISSASEALDVLPAALHLLFEDLVRVCLRFLEAVPWTKEEETRVLEVVPLLDVAESEPLLARISPRRGGAPSEDMLEGLISHVIHNYPNAAYAKNFVAVVLRDLSSRDSARAALERAFGESLRHVRESLEEYSSPDFRGDHDETEAKQRANLQTLLSNGRHLCWLIERMVELKVADKAVMEWSSQPGFTADLQRAFRDDAWRNIVPGLPAVMLRCTGKIATAVASGAILASTQVRMQLVKYWLPVLAVCRDNVSPMFPVHKMLYLELEEIFLKIISTLPLADAQELLQQCLGFSTRSVDDCKHLMSAFGSWFRRAARPPFGDDFH